MASNKLAMALSSRAAQWEWEGDRGVWQQYPMDVQEELTQAFDAGKSEVSGTNVQR